MVPITWPVVLCMYNSVLSIGNTSLYGSPDFICGFSRAKTAWLASELLVSMGPSTYVWFMDAQITNLYVSQTSPVILCMQYIVIRTRNSCLHGSHPLSAVFVCKIAWLAPEWQVYMGSSYDLWLCACKTATLGPDLQVCMGPRPYLWFWAPITACLAQECQDHMGSSPHLCFCACKTETVWLELKVSLGPKLHLWFLYVKQRLLDQNNKSLWVPDMTCGLCMQNSVITIRITSHNGSQPSSVVLSIQNSDRRTKIACLYGSQTSPVVIYMQNSMHSIRIISLYGCQPSYVVYSCKTATFGPELQVSMGTRPHLSFCACNTSWLAPEILVSMGPSLYLRFLHAK